MFADGTLRPPKPPRSLPLSTGEEVPGGSSCRARLVLIEVKPGDVNLEALTKAQHQAASGVYASVMAGFIQWLAPRLDEQRERLKTVIDEWRAMNGMPHGRTAGNLAQLFFGIDLFLTFAVEVGAIPETKAATIKGNAKLALIELARRQSDHLRDSCPAQRFLELIAASLASYDAHVATTDGTIPTAERAWGWRQCEGQGRRIGWIDGDYVLLDPTASYAVAQDAARRLGESIGIKPATLWARLRDKGVLAETDETRERVKVRKTIACLQRRVEVLILRVADIVSIDPSACEKRADAPMFVIKGGTRDLTDEELIEMSELKDEMTTQGEQSCA